MWAQKHTVPARVGPGLGRPGRAGVLGRLEARSQGGHDRGVGNRVRAVWQEQWVPRGAYPLALSWAWSILGDQVSGTEGASK